MTVKPPAPPPLPDELERLLRRLRRSGPADQRSRLCGADDDIMKVAAHESTRLFDSAGLHRLDAGRPD
jgi:hypothetical protein